MKKKFEWKVFLVSLAIVFLVAFIGSLFTSPNTNTDWYNSIKPSITPPSYVFPIVWNILFFLIAISLYLSWIYSKAEQKKKISLVFGINFILNILWSILFFELKIPLVSFIEIIILEMSIIGMIIFTYKSNKISSYLLIPYLVWVAFASVLNFLVAF